MAINTFDKKSISNYNATPPSDDGSKTSQNLVTWAKIKEKLPDPIKTAYDLQIDNLNNVFADVSLIADNYAELTSATASDIDSGIVQTLGRAASGDGGVGFWRWDSSSTSTANGGTILAADAGGTGRWLRLYGGPVSVKWFGASPSATPAENVTAFQAAFDSGETYLYIPAGAYSVNFPLFINTAGTKLVGAGESSIIRFDNSVDTNDSAWQTANGFTVGSRIGLLNVPVGDVLVSDFQLDENFRNSGRNILTQDELISDLVMGGFSTGGGAISGFTARNIRIYDYAGDAISGFSAVVNNALVEKCRCTSTYIVQGLTSATTNFGRQGINFNSGTNIRIEGNGIEGALDDAIATHSACVNVNINDNIITTTGGNILVSGCRNATVDGNTIQYITNSNASSAIYITFEDQGSGDFENDFLNDTVTVSNNNVYIPTGATVSQAIRYQGGGSRVKIVDNFVYTEDRQGFGINIQDKTASGLSGGAAVYNGGTFAGDEVTVSGNTVVNFNEGIKDQSSVSESGTAQAGAASTITLAVAATSSDDHLNTWGIYITGGTGEGQYRRITDYNGTTKVATVDATWTANPDNTSTYLAKPIGNVLSTEDNELINCGIGLNGSTQRSLGKNFYKRCTTNTTTSQPYNDIFAYDATQTDFWGLENQTDFTAQRRLNWNNIAGFDASYRPYNDRWVMRARVIFALNAPDSNLTFELRDLTAGVSYITEVVPSGSSFVDLVFNPFFLPKTTGSDFRARLINQGGVNTTTLSVKIELDWIPAELTT